ncbi:family 65 glycosyl hydrolase domain-containing protein [Ochrovirga pacifica]|uniref:family 65 glycosyl hydrolase domain-containing protein n=1 Tax=Ochrovirga pacifica TaxID=1042376 RepID=UPI000255A561|nr:family 65 glycosyl hydrolase domain-containing protein [Ochrovirga pacifica]
MNQINHIANEWSIIENGFNPKTQEAFESICSLGNGVMGQRANFEEDYSGQSFQGSYIAGVYYPDKTKVGWWKNGYPEYFAKVLNAPNWIGIRVFINGLALDLNTCREILSFRRELNMKEGWFSREFTVILQNDCKIKVATKRFLSLSHNEAGMISYAVTPLDKDMTVTYEPYLDAGISNQDSNWDDQFWQITQITQNNKQSFITSHTLKTEFHVCTYMESRLFIDQQEIEIKPKNRKDNTSASSTYTQQVREGLEFSIHKFAGYTVDLYHDKNDLIHAAKETLTQVIEIGFTKLLSLQKNAWKEIWKSADITIDGDVKAQQGIRFNIFQLNQTYSGADSRLNIGPKGFTGEKYGGSTYWDTEAYCLPFYMATKNQTVARNLLTYRYNHLQKAIENAKNLGFTNGAALYPMVTMNGEECHNEWEITFEEIHRNGAIAFAIKNYIRYTGDYSYIPEKGLEVLIGIARYWHQRVSFSKDKNQYVMLGVTGPNEYENNINNNWYTNYLAQWCIYYTLENIQTVKEKYTEAYNKIQKITGITTQELNNWKKVADNMYFPFSQQYGIYLQQDGFLDKEFMYADELDPDIRPINQHWSWDKILRSPFIKQADVLQGFYVFEDHFSLEEIKKHFDFYEPFTVHESSLSPCIHSILAAKLNQIEQAYQFYLRTSRLDLDDYNKEVHEGLHITSMAGTWMSIVEGFGGMRIKNNQLSFEPRIPKEWKGYSFKINFRNQIVHVNITQENNQFTVDGTQDLTILVNGKQTIAKAIH